MVKISIYLLASMLALTSANAQSLKSKYEPSASNPFGLPNPSSPEQIKDYEPLIGVCDCVSIRRNPDQTWGDSIPMRWEWKYVLDGTAVQDVTYRADNTSSSSMRQYNTDSATWYVTYFTSGVSNPQPNTWAGGLNETGDIILSVAQKAPNGFDGYSILKFQNITNEGFEWRADWESANGQFKSTFWAIDCKKRK